MMELLNTLKSLSFACGRSALARASLHVPHAASNMRCMDLPSFHRKTLQSK